jgi:hypothetical protein
MISANRNWERFQFPSGKRNTMQRIREDGEEISPIPPLPAAAHASSPGRLSKPLKQNILVPESVLGYTETARLLFHR